MALRNGQSYRQALKDERQIWVDGERVADVTIDPRFASVVDSIAELYDLQKQGTSWHAGSGAIWSLKSNALRPAGWTSADAAGLLHTAIADPDPVLFLEHKKCYRLIKGDVPDVPRSTPIGLADVKREGTDLTVVSYGYELHRCLDAAARLEQDEGIHAEVVDVRSLAPLDTETILASVRKTARAMVVYEDNRTYGAGAEIAATIAEQAMFDLDAPIVRIGGPDIPAMPFAGALEHYYMEPEPDHIFVAMRELAHF